VGDETVGKFALIPGCGGPYIGEARGWVAPFGIAGQFRILQSGELGGQPENAA